MNVVFSARAEADLREILADISTHHPDAYIGFRSRLTDVLLRIGRWPEAAQKLKIRPNVRMVPMIRYPYHLFYTVGGGTVEFYTSCTVLEWDRFSKRSSRDAEPQPV